MIWNYIAKVIKKRVTTRHMPKPVTPWQLAAYVLDGLLAALVAAVCVDGKVLGDGHWEMKPRSQRIYRGRL
jgi:hypothetical protein